MKVTGPEQTVPDRLIEIIIPNWNGEQMLECCLASLQKQNCANFSVTVVDNGSEDESVQRIERDFPHVKVIQLDQNTGFAHAVNVGIEKSEAPWILLLNNDMEIAPDCLFQLEAGINRYRTYDFFALKMMSFQNRELLDGAGDGVLRGGVGYRIGTMEKDDGRYSKDRDCFGACGGAALYSRSFFERTGLFDADFFAYLEDVDLNLRARRRGLSCRYLASAVIYHIGSGTTGSRINPLTIQLSTRNNLRVLVKNYTLVFLVKSLLPLLAYQIAWFVFCVKKGQSVPWVKGVIDGLKLLPESFAKRKEILISGMSIAESDFSRQIVASESEVINSIMSRRAAEGKNNCLLKVYQKVFC